MTPCLRPDELVDLVGRHAAGERAAHVTTCERCRAAAAELRATLAEIRDGRGPGAVAVVLGVDQPPGTRGHRRGAPALRPAWPAWLGWKAVVPLAAVAAALVVLGTTLMRPDAAARNQCRASPWPPSSAPSTGTAAGEPADDALALVVESRRAPCPTAPLEALGLAPLPDLGAAAAGALTEDEQLALEKLLRAAVDRPKS